VEKESKHLRKPKNDSYQSFLFLLGGEEIRGGALSVANPLFDNWIILFFK
jgi:hypothetical protein